MNLDNFVNAAAYYNNTIQSRKDTGYFFGLKMPKNPIIVSTIFVILASGLEAVFGTYLILPVIVILVCTEIMSKGKANMFIMEACMDYEMEFNPLDNDERDHLISELIGGVYESMPMNITRLGTMFMLISISMISYFLIYSI